jgi:hypothetical protein
MLGIFCPFHWCFGLRAETKSKRNKKKKKKKKELKRRK